MIPGLRAVAGSLLLAGLMLGGGQPSLAKPSATVAVSFPGAAAALAGGGPADVVVRLDAHGDAPDVTVEVLPAPGVIVLAGPLAWTGSLAAGQGIDLALRVEATGAPAHVLGVRVVTRLADGSVEESGAVLPRAAPPAAGPVPQGGPAPTAAPRMPPLIEPGRDGLPSAEGSALIPPAPRAVTGLVRGTARWRDAEGHAHPIRGAGVGVYQVVNQAGHLVAQTATRADGSYAVSVTLPSPGNVFTVAATADYAGQALFVVLPGTADSHQAFSTFQAPLGADTVLDILTAPPVRGQPGQPSQDDIASRAFSVFDAFRAFYAQGEALTGLPGLLPTLAVQFPFVGDVSFYRKSDQQIRVLREDALDWDVLGHEFFHFLTDVGSLRTIDDNPGGFHSFGSAIGQIPATGLAPRTREQALRLAWSEGLATFLSLAVQSFPVPGAAFDFPAGLRYVADGAYTDLEDGTIDFSIESPVRSEGYASESSVMGFLWDLIDAAADAAGGASDTVSGPSPRVVWEAITELLPCDPCDRLDRLWAALARTLGINSPASLGVARALALNNVAPRALSPADGAQVAGGLRPTFTWARNGDPAAAHASDTFTLVFSQDDFRTFRFVLVPTPGVSSHTLSEAEWNGVLQGVATGSEVQWLVTGRRADGPTVPESLFWLGNSQRFRPRALHARITWDRVGADVDLHLRYPGGEIDFQNRSTGWGFLDRDCTSQCAEENISVSALTADGVYRLYAHYYSDHGLGPTTVRAEVFDAGVRIVDRTFVLGASGQEETIVATTVDLHHPAAAPVDAGTSRPGPAVRSKAPRP